MSHGYLTVFHISDNNPLSLVGGTKFIMNNLALGYQVRYHLGIAKNPGQCLKYMHTELR